MAVRSVGGDSGVARLVGGPAALDAGRTAARHCAAGWVTSHTGSETVTTAENTHHRGWHETKITALSGAANANSWELQNGKMGDIKKGSNGTHKIRSTMTLQNAQIL